jgi:high-affinity iron transporter
MTFSRLSLIIIVLFVSLFSAPVGAADEVVWQSTWQAFVEIRRALFAAQGALLQNNTLLAEQEIAAAQTSYTQSIRPLIAEDLPEVVNHLDTHYEQAQASAKANDSLALTVMSEQIWTGLLQAGLRMTLLDIEREDGEAAQGWLMLREFRPSTVITRPRADATEEVYALVGGWREAADVLEVVNAELYDTYQTLLNQALYEADQAEERGFMLRRAQEISRAAGYFDILAPVFGKQRGDAGLSEMRAAFDALLAEGLAGTSTRYRATRQMIDEGLRSFVAAPLTDGELSRRAGEMLRFLSLVPVEYNSAVRNAEIINDIEYRDTLRFYQSARLGFTDLRPMLEENGPDSTRKLESDFVQLEKSIRALDEPIIVQRTTFEMTTTFSSLIPMRWRSIDSAADLHAVRIVLDQVKHEVLTQDYDLALASCVALYAMLQETIEQKLEAFAPDVVLRIDSLLWQGDSDQQSLAALLATGGSVASVQNALMKLEAALDEAEIALSAKSAPGAVISNSAIIVFREGLEAVLILAALLASLRAFDARNLRKPVLLGALLAGILAGITWWVTSGILRSFTGLGVELEAVVSLISLGVMLLVTNWFFHKVYWVDHMAALHTRKQQVIGLGQRASLFGLGFVSVYREGFETALFLQPLTLTSSYESVIVGVALGLLGVFVIGGIVFALNARLPYRRMLVVTGCLIMVVLVTLVGSTVYTFQINGWIPISPIPDIRLPRWLGQWFGIFPTWQGIGLQALSLVFIVGSYLWVEKIRRPRARTRPPQPQSHPV